MPPNLALPCVRKQGQRGGACVTVEGRSHTRPAALPSLSPRRPKVLKSC